MSSIPFDTLFTEPPAIDIQAEIAAGKAIIPTLPKVLQFELIGSATYLPEARDVDFAVLIDPTENAVDYAIRMNDDGWGSCGEYDSATGIWAAVRRDNLNLMVSHDPVFYDRYKTAMQVCKALRLKHKEDRIAVCQIVRDGRTADEVMTSGQSRGSVGIWPDHQPTPDILTGDLFAGQQGDAS